MYPAITVYLISDFFIADPLLSVIHTESLNKPFAIHALVSGFYFLKFKFLADNHALWVNIIFQTGCTLALLITHIYLMDPFFPMFSRQSVPQSPTSAFSVWIILAIAVGTLAVVNNRKCSWTDRAIL